MSGVQRLYGTTDQLGWTAADQWGGAMSQRSITEGVGALDDHTDEAGFLMLGLAQIVTMFALWMGLWPAAFGIPKGSALATILGTAFTLAGAGGFYLAFRTLSLERQSPT